MYHYATVVNTVLLMNLAFVDVTDRLSLYTVILVGKFFYLFVLLDFFKVIFALPICNVLFYSTTIGYILY